MEAGISCLAQPARLCDRSTGLDFVLTMGFGDSIMAAMETKDELECVDGMVGYRSGYGMLVGMKGWDACWVWRPNAGNLVCGSCPECRSSIADIIGLEIVSTL